MIKATPAWLVPVAAIFILQTTAAFLTRFIPMIAPAISEEFTWGGNSIGYLTAMNSLGGLTILLCGSGLLKHIGGMRTLQISLFVGAASMALFLNSHLGIALAACFFMGLSNGTANPAGSEVLQRFSPPGKRNLIFSIKQAGVPLGGVIAGLIVPVMVILTGWRLTLFVCSVLVIVPTTLTWRMSAQIDGRMSLKRWRWSKLGVRSLHTLKAPLQSLTHNRGLLRMSIVGSLFAVSQSCWFTFTVIYLIEGLGFTLSHAGVVFAVMQAGGVIGRVALGWISDRLQSATTTLSIAAIVSASTTLLLGLSSPEWPLWAIVVLAFIAGGSAASWNGVQIAEVARRSHPDMISETAAGSSILVNLTNMLVPAIFAGFLEMYERYDLAFGIAGACTLLVLVALPREK